MPFKKGDPNINRGGRARGSKNKALTNSQLADELGKGCHHAVKAIIDIIRDDKSSNNEKLKASFGLLDADYKMRSLMQKPTPTNSNPKNTVEEEEEDEGLLADIIGLTMEGGEE